MKPDGTFGIENSVVSEFPAGNALANDPAVAEL